MTVVRRLPLALLSAAVLAATTLPVIAAPAPERQLLLALDVTRAGVPAPATVQAALAAAGGLGLRLVSRRGSLLRVAGPASSVARLFPVQRSLGGAPLPALALPGALRASVTAALDPADTRPLWHRRDDVARHLTDAPSLARSYGITPPPSSAAPVLTAQTPVVASLQLGDWDPADLTRYAREILGRADDPVATGQYRPVFVATPSPDPGFRAEVALDQETILGAAPQLRQRPYFTSNTPNGVIAALDQVLADVQAGVPIVTFSTSYGACEQAQGSAFIDATEARLEALVAAGVTVTAASGDSGRYDCTGGPDPNTSTNDLNGDGVLTPLDDAVDFPASSPVVIAVGGTRHESGGASPTVTTELAWDDGVRSLHSVGAGGGTSTSFALPSYQLGLAPPGFLPSRRLVPDLALDADPQTGVAVLLDGAQLGVGGTSLGAPLAAASVADLVAGRTGACQAPVGLGDLHPALYAAPAGTFLDVVARKIRSATTPATQDPAAGYDLVTGLGAPVWSALDAGLPRPTLVGLCATSASEAAGALRFTVTLDRPAASPVTASWAVTGGTGTAGTTYSDGSGTVTIAAGSVTGELSVPLIDDTAGGPTTTVQVQLTAASGGTMARVAGGTAVGTVFDDDGPVFMAAGEAGAASTAAAASAASAASAATAASAASAGPARLTAGLSATFAPVGSLVTLRGRLTRGASGIANTAVAVSEQYSDGKRVPLGRPTTGPDGSWSLRVRVLYNGTMTASALGASASTASRSVVVFRSATARSSGGGVVVDADTRPGFVTGPGRQERVQVRSVDAAGRVLAVLATVNAANRTFPAGEAHGTNAVHAVLALPPGRYRLVVKVIGTPVNTGASSRMMFLQVP